MKKRSSLNTVNRILSTKEVTSLYSRLSSNLSGLSSQAAEVSSEAAHTNCLLPKNLGSILARVYKRCTGSHDYSLINLSIPTKDSFNHFNHCQTYPQVYPQKSLDSS